MIEETFTQNEINTEESDKNENTVIDDFIKKEEVIEKSLNAIIILNKLKKEKKISDVNETPDLKYESTKSETVLNTEKNEDKVITAIETENKNELIEKNIIEDKSLNFIDKVIEHISEIEQRKNSSKNLTDNTIQKTNENEIVDSDENSNSEIKDGDKEIISQNENIETEETIENELEMGLIKLISRMHDYYYVEEWNKLILITDKIIEIEPKFELAYIKRSSAKGNLGDYDGSIADCKKIISLNPCNAEAYYNAGLAYYFTENYDDAIEFLQNAIKNNISDLDKVYLIIAKSYSKKNNLINEYEYLNKSSQLGNTTAKDLLFKLKRKQIIDLHEYTEGYVIKTIKTDKNGCSDICFNLNNDLAAVTGFGNSIKIYKTRNWEVVFELNSPASSVSFSKDGLYLAVCGYNSIQIWDITTKEFQKIRHLETIQGDLKKVFFDYENKNVITTDNSTLYSFNIKSSQFEKKITDFHYFAKTKDSLYIVGTDYFKSIIIYRTSDFSIFAKIKFDFETDIKSISINNDVRKLVVGDSNGNFYIYLIKTGKVLVKVKTNENNAISSINFDPNGKYILTCAGTKTVNFWDSSNGNLIKSIKTKFIPKFSVLSNNGYYLAMGGFTDSVDFWYIKKDELN
jgi:WD40 repeat protein